MVRSFEVLPALNTHPRDWKSLSLRLRSALFGLPRTSCVASGLVAACQGPQNVFGRCADNILAGPTSGCRCRNRCLRLPVYSILLLCLTTQGLGLGDAAKPKSAKQHFGGSSNSPNQNQNQNQNHNDVLGGVGAPSQTSGEDEAEIMYPFQSGEQMFGLEEDQEQDQELNSNAVPGSDEDNAANQRGINVPHPIHIPSHRTSSTLRQDERGSSLSLH
ncbi:hypothetical protein M5D96_004387 [Drosophila gunungcola]|uniref:Uncharacterized protein n=1 Tax=Drosophila gunungcola TaxID=103775 RepID=A0A9P9YTZ8_9MUSC|nr:hypothetical protein M5D96_004387 [Drosophila gunungcola]